MNHQAKKHKNAKARRVNEYIMSAARLLLDGMKMNNVFAEEKEGQPGGL